LQPPLTSVSPDYLTARIGDVVDLHCTVVGYPEPRVDWVRGPRGALPNDVVIDNGWLRFRATSKEQEGVYECSGSSSIGSSLASSFVVIDDGGYCTS